ncbi:hypothetical protein [Solirubrobacter soli]|uniref:hypothetical protein n=1 Tax=Solirubrobacter soli TaxID=363832 RepID=UPI00040E582B|nr:hypothetical protein [Solirubrobacter soli]
MSLSKVSKEMQLAGLAAILLALSELLPWYQKSYFQAGKVVQANVRALGVFTFVEAAVLLVAVAVLFLVWARSREKAFHLPGGDGVAITLAGGWAVLLLVWRLFDKPGIQGAGATMGIQWGIFGALLAAGLLIAAGARVRAAHAPEPPNPAADDTGWVAPPQREPDRRPDRRPRDATAVTEMLRERPTWEEQTTRLDESTTTRLPDPADARTERLFDDPSRAKTTRLPEDPADAPTRRQRRPEDTPPLWEDDPPR